MTVDQALVHKVGTNIQVHELSFTALSEREVYQRDTIHNYSTRSNKDLEIPKSNHYKLRPKNFSSSRDQTLEQPA